MYPLANIFNCFTKKDSDKIIFKQQVIFWASMNLFLSFDLPFLLIIRKCQFIMWWAGLMRGAVTIALSYNQVP